MFNIGDIISSKYDPSRKYKIVKVHKHNEFDLLEIETSRPNLLNHEWKHIYLDSEWIKHIGYTEDKFEFHKKRVETRHLLYASNS